MRVDELRDRISFVWIQLATNCVEEHLTSVSNSQKNCGFELRDDEN